MFAALLALAPFALGGEYEYGLIIDAGSTHSSIYVYKWQARSASGSSSPYTPPTTQVGWSMEQKPGISTFTDDYAGVGSSLAPLIAFARTITDPLADASTIPIYLGATAGMRMLSAADQDGIMSAIRAYFSDPNTCAYKFSPEYARILAGEEEGAFGFLAANYLLGTLSTGQYGALDLGGASTQISYRPYAEPGQVASILANYFPLYLHNVDYGIYTHSFLQYGAKQMQLRTKADVLSRAGSATTVPYPCWNTGNDEANSTTGVTLVGSSNFTQCDAEIRALFFSEKGCLTDTCSFNLVYQPSLANVTFLAFSAYYSYVVEDVGLSTTATVADIRTKAQDLCSQTDAQLNATYGPSDYYKSYCIGLTYIAALLGDGYGFGTYPAADAPSLQFVGDINGTEAGWALGYMLNQIHFMSWKILQNCPADKAAEAKDYRAATFVLLALLLGALATLVWLYNRKNRNDDPKPYAELKEPVIA